MTIAHAAGVRRQPFGLTPAGAPASLFTLTNAHGLRAQITSYGGCMTRLLLPDREGRFADVLLGHRTLAEDLGRGRLSGRAHRPGGQPHRRQPLQPGRPELEPFRQRRPGGRPCHLHGGPGGFHRVLWRASPLRTGGAGLRLRYLSPDGEEGYPGSLAVTVDYRLTDADELILDYQATCDRATPVNLTQHNYYNLGGEGGGDALEHLLTLHASRYLPVDEGLIPTGELAPVAGTPFDFTRPEPIGARIGAGHPQLRCAGGYDHTWVIDRAGPGLVHAATVLDPRSGRRMEVWTDQPGIQFYSGNAIPSSGRGKDGAPHRPHQGFCLETQHYPDAVHHPEFPSVILRPLATYRTATVHRFSAG